MLPLIHLPLSYFIIDIALCKISLIGETRQKENERTAIAICLLDTIQIDGALPYTKAHLIPNKSNYVSFNKNHTEHKAEEMAK